MCFPLHKDVASQMARAEEYTVPQNLNVNTGKYIDVLGV